MYSAWHWQYQITILVKSQVVNFQKNCYVMQLEKIKYKTGSAFLQVQLMF